MHTSFKITRLEERVELYVLVGHGPSYGNIVQTKVIFRIGLSKKGHPQVTEAKRARISAVCKMKSMR